MLAARSAVSVVPTALAFRRSFARVVLAASSAAVWCASTGQVSVLGAIVAVSFAFAFAFAFAFTGNFRLAYISGVAVC